MLDNAAIKNIILNQFEGLTFQEEDSPFLNVWIPPVQLKEFGRFLRDNRELNFDFLFCVTGVDWPKEATLEVVYHLRSVQHGHQMVFRCKTGSRDHPELDSLSEVWPTAHLHEREIYDLFGIKFKGHSNLKRLFLDENWEGHPLLKDYEDKVNLIVK